MVFNIIPFFYFIIDNLNKKYTIYNSIIYLKINIFNMANKIIHKHSSAIDNSGSVAKAKLPTYNQLEFGEIALNYAKGHETISFKNNANEIVEFKDKLYIDNVYDELAQAINDLSDVVDEKQDILVSGESIKTINGETILGSGNISLNSGGFVNGGIVNIEETGDIESVYEKLEKGGIALCIIGDNNGNYPSLTETRVNVNPEYCVSDNYFFSDEERGANVGDLLMITKQDFTFFSLCTLRIIPVNDAKVPTDDYAGTEGIVTVWDKQEINKIGGIEWTANYVRDNYLSKDSSLPTHGGWDQNMDDCLETGIYPWCLSGKPDDAQDGTHFTCFTFKSSTADGSGYYTYMQMCFGREGADLGKIYQRVFFLNGSNDNWGEGWKQIDGGGANFNVVNDLISGGETEALSAEMGKVLKQEIDENAYVSAKAFVDLNDKLSTKQDNLINGETIKTINGENILGDGDIVINANTLGLSYALKYCGVTTTEITDGSDVTSIVIDGNDHIPENGCVVFYGNKEFVFNGTVWNELGYPTDISSKQDIITDLNDIREHSNLGYAAYQSLENYYTKSDVDENISSNINEVKGIIRNNENVTASAFNDLHKKIYEIDDTVKEEQSTTIDSINLLNEEIAKKQDKLIDGENIKTVNGEAILGEGNIEISVDLSEYYNKEEVDGKIDEVSNVIFENEDVVASSLNDLNDRVNNVNDIKIAQSYELLCEISAKTGSFGAVISNPEIIPMEDIYIATLEETNTNTDEEFKALFDKLTSIDKMNVPMPTEYKTTDINNGFFLIGEDHSLYLIFVDGVADDYLYMGCYDFMAENEDEGEYIFWEMWDGDIFIYEDNVNYINNLIKTKGLRIVNVLYEMEYGFATDFNLLKNYVSFEKGEKRQELYVNNGTEWEEFSASVDVVNNLTDGGIDKALSAEMGKVLNEKISVEPIRYKGYVSIDDKTDIDIIFDDLKVGETCLCVPSTTEYGPNEHSYLPWVMTALNSDYMYINESLLSIDKSQFTLGNIANLIAGKGEIRTYFKLDENNNSIRCPDLLLLAKVKVNLKDFLEATDGVSDTILSLIPDNTEMTACIGKIMRWSAGDELYQYILPELSEIITNLETTVGKHDEIINNNLPFTRYVYNDTNPDINLKTGVNAYFPSTINGITANWSLFVNCSVDTDGNGYYHLTQTIVCRDAPNEGRMWKRFGFYKPNVETKFFNWYEIGGGGSGSNSNVNFDEVYERIDELESIVNEGQYVCSKALVDLDKRSGSYREVLHDSSETVVTLTPNTLHVWDEVETLELSFGEKIEGITNEYIFQFTSGEVATTLNIHGTVRWADIPNITANKVYQVSILNGLGNIIEYN